MRQLNIGKIVSLTQKIQKNISLTLYLKLSIDTKKTNESTP